MSSTKLKRGPVTFDEEFQGSLNKRDLIRKNSHDDCSSKISKKNLINIEEEPKKPFSERLVNGNSFNKEKQIKVSENYENKNNESISEGKEDILDDNTISDSSDTDSEDNSSFQVFNERESFSEVSSNIKKKSRLFQEKNFDKIAEVSRFEENDCNSEVKSENKNEEKNNKKEAKFKPKENLEKAKNDEEIEFDSEKIRDSELKFSISSRENQDGENVEQKYKLRVIDMNSSKQIDNGNSENSLSLEEIN